jgi:hypothetical protein
MVVDFTCNVSEELRRNSWCYCYNVYWKDNRNIDAREWKCTAFYSLREAKEFAKGIWKKYKAHKLKPYILEKVVPCTFFKKDVFIALTIVDEKKFGYDYIRKVW